MFIKKASVLQEHCVYTRTTALCSESITHDDDFAITVSSRRIFPTVINQVRSTVKQTATIFTWPETLAQNSDRIAVGRGKNDEKRKKNGRENIETNHASDGRKQKYKHKSRTVLPRHTDQNLPQRPARIYAFIYKPTLRSTVNFEQ